MILCTVSLMGFLGAGCSCCCGDSGGGGTGRGCWSHIMALGRAW